MSRAPVVARVRSLTIALSLATLPAVSNAAKDCPHKAGWRPNGAQLKLLREGHKSGFQEENLDLPEGAERGAICNIDLKGADSSGPTFSMSARSISGRRTPRLIRLLQHTQPKEEIR